MENKQDGISARESPLRLHIGPTAEWQLRSGHPWLFSESVVEQNRDGRTGDVAVIYDRHDNFLALGLFDPNSPIRVRIIHKGKPTPVDDAFWEKKFDAAQQKRAELFDANTTGYRVIHGENDGFPGLVVDRYAEACVIKLYTAAWFPRLKMVVDLVQPRLNAKQIVLRLSRNVQDVARGSTYADGRSLSGPPVTAPIIFHENGLQFQADILRGQKTGFFLDQRENRSLIEQLSSKRRVLNLFSFSGGFSVYAARGGAAQVTDVDISAHALESATRNFALNPFACQHVTIKADVFDWLARAQDCYDLIVIDPPSLAKRNSEREGALKAYGMLIENAIKRLNREGIMVACSCSAHVSRQEFFQVVHSACRGSGRFWKELRTTEHPPDHPATFAEAHYLKAVYVQLS